MAVLAAGGGETPVDFDTQVIPVFTKAGCNTGACHGAAVGRGGFKLSLYGGDPAADYRAIVLELKGRRINLAQPDDSLLLLKSTESLEHGGGYLLPDEGPGANRLRRWIAAGAERAHTRRLVSFQVQPKLRVAKRVGAIVRFKATARFNDGATVDATPWTVFTPEDAAAIEIDPETAVATLLRRGRQIVVARYLDRVVPIEIITPLADTAVDLSRQPRNNFIDDHVLDLLATLRLPVAPAASAAAFLRRLTLDLTGRLPSLAEQRAYAENTNSGKRQQLINRLLASEEFNEYWTFQLAKLLRIRSQPEDTQGALAYHRWLKRQVSAATPYDQFAREILLASGDTHEVGPANFYRTVGGARKQAEFASELFMGNRLRCANCHNHPLDRWTQDDYHGLAALFAKLDRGRVIKINPRGKVTHPRTGAAAIPRIPGGEFLDPKGDGREAFATWLTDRNNPYFAKAMVNRLWKALLGRGLVEPTDDLRATNPATHPALLAALADDFVEHRYDLRHTLRRIASSATYGRSAQSLPQNAADNRYYSHALTRPLPAEVLADAISDLTGVAEQYGDQPLGARAVALFDPKIESESLDILGRCARVESCETADATAGGLTRKLHLFNGPLLNRRIADSAGRLAKLLAEGRTPEEIVNAFYRLALSRPPTSPEREFWSGQFANAGGKQQQQEFLEDFLWSLLTCRAFVTNH